MTRVVIDPVTRIGGHLRIEARVADASVTDAWSSGTMFRGLEAILRDRDPRDAWLFAQRVCGTCTGVHALASVRAVERALGLEIPTNARLVRNLIAGSEFLIDHVVRFYHQHALDWVDAASALEADPAATSTLARSTSEWPASSASHFDLTRRRLAGLHGSSGPFANGYWGHPAYRLSPEQNLLVLAHYLDALDWQRSITRINTLLGGKNPHPQTFLVGGMVMVPPWGGPHRALPGEHPQQVDRRAPNALTEQGLADLADLIAVARLFVKDVYVPDVYAIASAYGDWLGIGAGTGNFLSFGEFPVDDTDAPTLFLPRGRLLAGAPGSVEPVDQAGISEVIAHSHYEVDGDGGATLHPLDGRAIPRYAGPALPFTTLEGSERYSWIKAPRYDGKPMEVGALARVLVGYASGREDLRAVVDDVTARLGTGLEGLTGTLGRVVARAVEARLIADQLDTWHKALVANLATGDLALADVTMWNPSAWPSEAEGWSLGEGPRGALGHWTRIRDRRIASYAIVDPSTWNASPRDDAGHRGACEEALVGTPVADPARPLEILRTVHSFDPCTACAVHAVDPDGAGSLDLVTLQEARP